MRLCMGVNLAANAGVDANTGFSFQKCSALYLLLDNFPEINARQYFMAFEHYDDFLFVFLNDEKELSQVEAYQAKKNTSAKSWGTNKDLAEIICKLTVTGDSLRNDDLLKASNYQHSLRFISNSSIQLNNGLQGKKSNKVTVKMDKSSISYSDLDDDIKANILSKIHNVEEDFHPAEAKNLYFDYIDLANKHKENKEMLIGKMNLMFEDEISDYKAAVETLMLLFHESELTYNPDSVPKLSDILKRISKEKINDTLNILTTETKAYKYWRENAVQLSQALNLNLGQQRKHKEYLHNCFDYFKSLNNAEFIKILHFVRDNEDIDACCMTDVEGICQLRNELMSLHRFNMESHMISFAVLAAYVETRQLNV